MGPHDATKFKEGLDLFLDLTAIIMLSLGNRHMGAAKTTEEKRELAKQHFPRMFGLGKADEGIWAMLIRNLSNLDLATITAIVGSMLPEQREEFILTVAAAPIVTTMGADKEKDVEFTENDGRVLLLKRIAEYAREGVASNDMQSIIKRASGFIRANRLITNDPWFKGPREFLMKLTGVQSVEEFSDPSVLAMRLRMSIIPKIDAYRKNQWEKACTGSWFNIFSAKVGKFFNI